jgi:hypothetical protein
MLVDMAMRQKPLRMGQTVNIKPQVKEYGGKVGTVVGEGQELGWRVVKVKFNDQPRPVTFAADEVERN